MLKFYHWVLQVMQQCTIVNFVDRIAQGRLVTLSDVDLNYLKLFIYLIISEPTLQKKLKY